MVALFTVELLPAPALALTVFFFLPEATLGEGEVKVGDGEVKVGDGEIVVSLVWGVVFLVG